ncbi:MAG TPA: tetratricopeptide repeat protein [Sporichthyaceae bacterium]|jgi:putative thioredoxin|nr:tetratricopeptide repeat protein [Sporichthyaceae bacterium]
MPQQPPTPRIPTAGAVDLSALKARANRPAPAPPGAPTPPRRATGSGSALGVTDQHRGAAPAEGGSGSPFVIEVTEASFEADVIGLSMQVPVLIDFWADWCEPCKQLSPVLEKLADEYDGRFVLAKIDVEANQRLAALIQVQALPTVLAVVGQQPMPLFQGALPEAQVREVIEQVLDFAVTQGISGRVAPDIEAEEADGPTAQLRHPQALEALARNDLDGAQAAYAEALNRQPGDPEAEQGLARVALLRRVYVADPATVRRAAAERPADVAVQCLAADLDTVGGSVEEAFRRLIDTVRITSGADRDAAREHLLQLFLIAGPDDPRVAAARRALASALF